MHYLNRETDLSLASSCPVGSAIDTEVQKVFLVDSTTNDIATELFQFNQTFPVLNSLKHVVNI